MEALPDVVLVCPFTVEVCCNSVDAVVTAALLTVVAEDAGAFVLLPDNVVEKLLNKDDMILEAV